MFLQLVKLRECSLQLWVFSCMLVSLLPFRFKKRCIRPRSWSSPIFLCCGWFANPAWQDAWSTDKVDYGQLGCEPSEGGQSKEIGAHPNSHFLKHVCNYQRMDMFNTMFDLYLSGRFFKQDAVSQELWMEDPRPLTELLTKDGQWYDTHFCRVSKMLTALLRRSDDPQMRLLRRNRTQGDKCPDWFPSDGCDAQELPDFMSCLSVGFGTFYDQDAFHLWNDDWYW